MSRLEHDHKHRHGGIRDCQDPTFNSFSFQQIVYKIYPEPCCQADLSYTFCNFPFCKFVPQKFILHYWQSRANMEEDNLRPRSYKPWVREQTKYNWNLDQKLPEDAKPRNRKEKLLASTGHYVLHLRELRRWHQLSQILSVHGYQIPSAHGNRNRLSAVFSPELEGSHRRYLTVPA